MNVCSLLVTDAKPAEVLQPRHSPLDFPSLTSQGTLRFLAAFRRLELDSHLPQSFPMENGIIRFVRLKNRRFLTLPIVFESDLRNGVDQRDHRVNVVFVRAGNATG